MSIIEQKYLDFPFNQEFPNLYMILLYESGGDFECYSRILGYTDFGQFLTDYKNFNETYKQLFVEPLFKD